MATGMLLVAVPSPYCWELLWTFEIDFIWWF